jgi:hypothetical protein
MIPLGWAAAIVIPFIVRTPGSPLEPGRANPRVKCGVPNTTSIPQPAGCGRTAGLGSTEPRREAGAPS